LVPFQSSDATVEALGLKKIGKTVELPNNDAVKGMVWHVRHLSKGGRNLVVIQR